MMSQKFKIVNLVHSLNSQGGLQRVVVNLANYWVSIGHDVEIWQLKYSKCNYPINENVKVRFLVATPQSKSKIKAIKYFHDLIRLLQCLSSYKRTLAKEKPDLVLIHKAVLYDTFLGFQTAYKGRTYEVLHNTFKDFSYKTLFPSYIGYVQDLRFHYLQPKQNLVVLNQTALEDAVKSGWKNVHCIPNAIHIPSDKKADITSKYLLAVGRGVPEKGFDILIKAFANVAHEFPDWKLRIIGEQVTNESLGLSMLVKNHDITRQVELLETVDNIGDYYTSSSIFILSSKYEGMPMVLLEAMDSGLPIITSDIEGILEMISPKCALIFKIGEIQELSEKIKHLILNPNIRASMSSESMIQAEKFYIENVNKSWTNLFNTKIL